MIAYLEGAILKKTDSYIILNVNSIGYKVHILPQALIEFSEKDNIKLYIHQYVREDSLSLYGFDKFEQLQTFQLLISISGIGPKLAFNIISTRTPSELKKAVLKTDVTIFSRIPGIGKKTASKILLELSNKLNIQQQMDKLIFTPEDELAIEALTNLGFKKYDAQKAIQQTGKKAEKLEEKIRAGLKYLNQ